MTQSGHRQRKAPVALWRPGLGRSVQRLLDYLVGIPVLQYCWQLVMARVPPPRWAHFWAHLAGSFCCFCCCCACAADAIQSIPMIARSLSMVHPPITTTRNSTSRSGLPQWECPLVALSGHAWVRCTCPVSGV